MNSLDKTILVFFNKASKRIKTIFLINLSIVGLKILLCLIFSLLLISLFIVIPYALEISIGILIIGFTMLLIYGITKKTKKEEIALIIDSKGLNERLTTALEIINDSDEISMAQKKDTVKYISKFDIKKNLKINIDKKQVLLLVIMIFMCILVMLVPTNVRQEAKKIRDFDKYQKTVIEKINKEEENIEKLNDLTKEEKKDIKKILDNTKKEIRESEKNSEVSKTLERLEKKLDNKRESVSSEKLKEAISKAKNNLLDDFNREKEVEARKELNKLVNELIKNKESKSLAEAILSEDLNSINQALSEIESKISNMNSAELNTLSESLQKAALQMGDGELAESLENAANSILVQKLDMQSLAKAISGSINKSNGQNNNQNNTQSGGREQKDNQGFENSVGKGSENGGNGSGSGSGQGSTGWNTGSTIGKENSSEHFKGEQIYIPDRNEGNDLNLTGDKSSSGDTQQIENQSGINIAGKKVEYDKVLKDYSNNALEATDNSNLPQDLKDIIQNYFEGLN